MKPPRIVAIDSMILIYAGMVPSGNAPSREFAALSRRSKILLHELQGHSIVLPAIAIAEILIPVDPNKRGRLAAALAETFVCPAFDHHAASIAADLWSRHRKTPAKSQYESRQLLRVDAMIIASAKAASATEFYTNDEKCRSLADLVMTGRRLPKTSEKLFIDEELELDEREGPAKPRTKSRQKPKK